MSSIPSHFAMLPSKVVYVVGGWFIEVFAHISISWLTMYLESHSWGCRLFANKQTKIECWCHVGTPQEHRNVRTQKVLNPSGPRVLKAHPHIQLRGGHQDHAPLCMWFWEHTLDLIRELLETQSHHSPILVCPTIWAIEGFQFSKQLLYVHLHTSFIERWKL